VSDEGSPQPAAGDPPGDGDELTFMMGKFAARFPTDRQYCKNHMWAQQQADGGYRIGFTAYAVRLLQDVYFLEWHVDAGASLREKELVGGIESSKAESELYSPFAGVLTEFNDVVLSDPAKINVDKYGAGWLFALDGPGGGLLSPAQYMEHLAAAWPVAQRTIKGQLNEDD
jgi:glycine cleavage system H protein